MLIITEFYHFLYFVIDEALRFIKTITVSIFIKWRYAFGVYSSIEGSTHQNAIFSDMNLRTVSIFYGGDLLISTLYNGLNIKIRLIFTF